MIRVGSLFSGCGALDMAVHAVLPDTSTAWFAEHEPPSKQNPRPSQAAARVLAHHWPHVPNVGDVSAVDWSRVEPVDILIGGTPCQDVSAAGKRAGMRAGTRSGLWAAMCDAIDALRPALIVWENVRGVLSAEADSALEPCPGCVGDPDDGPVLRALGRVLGDLAGLGYDTRWCGLRAADVGAPHGRYRIFIVAEDTDRAVGGQRRFAAPGQTQTGRAWADVGGRGGASAADADGTRLEGREPTAGRHLPARCAVTDAEGDGRHARRPEPARLVGGSDASVSGASPADPANRNQQGITQGHDRHRPLDRAGPRTGHRVGTGDPATRVHDVGRSAGVAWGSYGPAIARWETVLGRPAPAPTEAGPKGGQRLSPRFVEFMMGLPEGHVTAVPGISRNDQLRILGNGVVPAQAAAALEWLLTDALAVAP